MSTPLARCRSIVSSSHSRVKFFLAALAMVFTFLSSTRTAHAEGKQGAEVASVLAAESFPGAPMRARTAKAKPAARPARAGAAKPGHHGAKAKHTGHVTPAKAKPGKPRAKQAARPAPKRA